MQDEQNIPLLKDVVDPDAIEYTNLEEPVANKEILDPQAIMGVMREKIAAQLNQELQPIIMAAISSAVDQATGEIRQVMLDELQGSLQNRIPTLIEEALDKQFDR